FFRSCSPQSREYRRLGRAKVARRPCDGGGQRWFNRVGKANSVTPTIEGSQSDPSLVEMLINHEYFGFFLLISGCVFGNLTGVYFAVVERCVFSTRFLPKVSGKNAKKIKTMQDEHK
ncbi:MAG: hypothetical protein IJD06_07235, partial [Clostridia bacterium]|nr:hypothetical protein [Clostridia bacterium]